MSLRTPTFPVRMSRTYRARLPVSVEYEAESPQAAQAIAAHGQAAATRALSRVTPGARIAQADWSVDEVDPDAPLGFRPLRHRKHERTGWRRIRRLIDWLNLPGGALLMGIGVYASSVPFFALGALLYAQALLSEIQLALDERLDRLYRKDNEPDHTA